MRRELGFTARRDRGGEAQTGSGLVVILRYHVLRITVPIHMYACVYYVHRVYHAHTYIRGYTILLWVYFLFCLFLSLLPSSSVSRLLFLFRPLFSHLPCGVLFSPPVAAEGSLVFFLPLKLESLSRIPWRQIVCNAYLNTDTRYIPWSVLHTVAARDLKQERGPRCGITIFLLY